MFSKISLNPEQGQGRKILEDTLKSQKHQVK